MKLSTKITFTIIMSKPNRTSSAANAFGPGSDLIGMSHRGHKIINASRKYMYLDNGERVKRAGNKVEHDVILITSDVDTTAYMTDDL